MDVSGVGTGRATELSEDGIADFVRVDRVAKDVFSGECHLGMPGKIFGGQVAAQALHAAGQTVDPERLAHSMHAYFLRAGDVDRPVSYEVDRLSDGGSYSARAVHARQEDRRIFTLMASFKVPEEAGSRQRAMPAVPTPQELPDPYPDWARRRPDEHAQARVARAVETRVVPRDLGVPGYAPEPGVTTNLLWLRARPPVLGDQLLHQCALVYESDLSMAPTAALDHEEIRTLRVGPQRCFTASLDHAMWFHRPVRADEWLLFAMRGPSASDGRGLVAGHVWNTRGALVASITQETVLRFART